MANFDHERLLDFSINAIREFAATHGTEMFYGFSVDASLPCLNSLEAFEATLAGKYPEHHATAFDVEALRLH